MNIIVKNIKRIMQEKEWNAYRLEEASGVPQSTIHRLLSGKHADPRSSTIRKLALGLGTTEMKLRSEEKEYTNGNNEILFAKETTASYTKNKINRLPHIYWHEITMFLNSKKTWREFQIMPVNKIKLSKQSFMIHFESDIYADYLYNGETAVIDPKAKIEQGASVLVTINNQPHIMKYENIDKEYLHSIKGSKTITIEEQSDCKIIGSIVWIIPLGRKG